MDAPNATADIGLIGLAVMGENLVLNMESRGFTVAVYNRTTSKVDAFINGRFNGALTFSLVDAIRKGRGRLTYRQLHDRAAGTLKTRKFDQVPQLEGRSERFDQPLFFV